MAIVIENDVNPLLTGALAHMAGLAQQRREQQRYEQEQALRVAQFQQQSAADAARLQLQRDLAGDQNALARDQLRQRSRESQMAQAYNYAGRQQALAQDAAQSQNSIFASLFNNILQGNQRMALAGMEMQQGAIDDVQQEEAMQMQADAQLRNRMLYDIPDDIRTGLQMGHLRYSPEQKTRMQQLESALARLDTDMRLSPPQKMAAQRMLAEQRRQVMLNPTEVPFDERPLSPQEQFEQTAPLVFDEATGRQRRIAYDRNGVPKFLDEDALQQEAQAQQMAFKEKEFGLKERQLETQIEAKAKQAELDAKQRATEMRMKGLEHAQKAELDALAELKPDIATFTTPAATPEGKETVDMNGYKNAIAEFNSKQLEVINRYAQQIQSLSNEAQQQATEPEVPVAPTAADVKALYDSGLVPVGGKFIGPDGQLHTRTL